MEQGLGPYRTGIVQILMREPKLALLINGHYQRRNTRLTKKAERKQAEYYDKMYNSKVNNAWTIDEIVGVASLGFAGFVAASILLLFIGFIFAANLQKFGTIGAAAAVLEIAIFAALCVAGTWCVVEGPGFLRSKSKQLSTWAEKEVEAWESQ